MNGNHNEIVLKVIMELEKSNIQCDIFRIRDVLDNVLNDYEVKKKKNELVATDLPEKIRLFLACKRLDGLSQSTIKNYFYILRRFAENLIKPISAITTSDLRCYLAERAKLLKKSSIEPLIWTLKSFFSWLHDEGYKAENIAKPLKAPKRDKKARKGLDIEEIELMRNACEDSRERALVEFFLSTGCRVSEVVGLKLKDIKDGAIKVSGKGDKERYVYINPKAMMYLRIYVKERKIASEYIFIAERAPFNFIKERSMEKIISRIGKRAMLHTYPHIFRHTFASQLINNGAKLYEVQEMLGHEDANTTRIYAKMDNRLIRNVHQRCAVI